MSAFLALLAHELRLVRRQGGSLATALGFYLIVVVAMPLGLGPDLKLLSRIAPGVLWVALLLAALLTADRMFQDDFEDGTLEVLSLGPLPLEMVALVKGVAHWISVSLPLLLMARVLALMLNMEPAAYGPLMLSLLAGTPAVSFIAGIGSALTLGLRRAGVLLPLLILPLYVPVLIFGVSAIDAAVTGAGSFQASLSVLGALTLASAVLAPLATAAALRLNLQ
jgi:heme exporter protein B